MRLNHLNLTVPNVDETRDFMEKYFGFRRLVDRQNLTVLSDESGFVLTLNNFGKAAAVAYPKAFHIGFMQPNRQRVDEFYDRLKADGYDPAAPKEFHGAWTFYFNAPGGFMIEVFHQPGQRVEDESQEREKVVA
jgi:catechol 2,3-dioxygenase-like lactoylglutathione lyase family enzyme